jgi:hypothetical protein
MYTMIQCRNKRGAGRLKFSSTESFLGIGGGRAWGLIER